jgi:hypothetical protein
MRRTACVLVVLVLIGVAASGQESEAAAVWAGRWDGQLALAQGQMPFSLRITPGGALLDLPSAQLYGYPSAAAQVSGDSVALSFAFGGGLMTLAGQSVDGRVEGSFRQGDGPDAPGGTFFMTRSETQPDSSTQWTATAPDGARLAGTLLVPDGAVPAATRPPLVLLHAGLGAADRDGNNYNVPGKNDALRLLAGDLLARGVATYRYDKRGSGESSWLVKREEDMSLEAWIHDMAVVAKELSESGRYSGIWLLGLNDGALVAVSAANECIIAGTKVAGTIVACASADGTLDAFRKAVRQAPEDQRAEGEAIIAALLAGHQVESPSSYYAAAFRPSFQPYLIEAFKRDMETELALWNGPCLLIQGDMDMQATLADFMALGAARPGATTIMVPRMNHVLKDVSQDVEENHATFSDPGYRVSEILVDAIVKFVSNP